jgi:hypothetical protein
MAGRDEKEPWYWQHESFKSDSESPLVITPSFWEELTENGGDSSILYGVAPVMDTRSQPSSAACYAFAVDHQGARNEGIASGSPPYLSILGTSAALYSPFKSCTPPLVSGNEEYMLPVPCGSSVSSTSLWFPRVDNVSNSVLANAQQPGNTCRVRSFDETAYSACQQMKAPVLLVNDYNTSLVGGNTLQQSQHLHRPQILQEALHVQQSQHRLQTQELQVTDVLQGPRTPFSKPPFSGRKQSMGSSRFKGKSSNRVVFPFALVKPSAAQGDVTLNDINRHLLCPPPMPVQNANATNIAKPPAQSGAGLSGKSVVACTKIHTEGNGTITIMRTRG